jgi:hypothetical protein
MTPPMMPSPMMPTTGLSCVANLDSLVSLFISIMLSRGETVKKLGVTSRGAVVTWV